MDYHKKATPFLLTTNTCLGIKTLKNQSFATRGHYGFFKVDVRSHFDMCFVYGCPKCTVSSLKNIILIIGRQSYAVSCNFCTFSISLVLWYDLYKILHVNVKISKLSNQDNCKENANFFLKGNYFITYFLLSFMDSLNKDSPHRTLLFMSPTRKVSVLCNCTCAELIHHAGSVLFHCNVFHVGVAADCLCLLY